MFIDFTERGRWGEKHRCEREASIGCSRMCPNWGSNLQPFGVWDDVPAN